MLLRAYQYQTDSLSGVPGQPKKDEWMIQEWKLNNWRNLAGPYQDEQRCKDLVRDLGEITDHIAERGLQDKDVALILENYDEVESAIYSRSENHQRIVAILDTGHLPGAKEKFIHDIWDYGVP